MRVKVPGPVAWAAAALAALVGAAAVLVHTPPAARWGRDWLIRTVASQWQLELTAGELDFNLFTRHVTLSDVRLAAPGHADLPFFTARRVDARVPWAIYGGTVRVSRLEIDDARVQLVRQDGDIVNLPPSSGAPPPIAPRRFDLRGLHVRNLDVDYVDRTGDTDVTLAGLDLALEGDGAGPGARGAVSAERLRVRMGAHDTTSAALDGRLAFDGSHVTLETLTVPLPEGRVDVGGRIERVLDTMRFALTLQGTLDYAQVAAWTPPPVPVSGAGTFRGTFEGPLGGYELKATFASGDLRIGRATGLPLGGTLSVTPPRALIAPFAITAPATADAPRQGAVEGRFTYTFGTGASDLEATFRDLDLDVALAAYDQEPLTFAAWQQGTARLRRPSPRAPMSLVASGTSRPLARADRVALDGTWTATLANDRWQARHDHRLLDAARAYGTVAWPAAADASRQTLSGPLTLEIADVGRVVAAGRRSGINLSESLAGLSGAARGDLAMDGSVARMVIRGRVESSGLTLPAGQAATAHADIVYDGESLEATTFAVTTPGGSVSGDVRMGMTSGRLSGAYSGAIEDLALVAAPYTTATLTGAATFRGTIGGTTDVPDVPFTFRSTPLDVAGQHLGVVDAAGRLDGTTVRVASLGVDQAPGTLRGAGSVDYLTGAYDLTVDGRGLQWHDATPGAAVAAVTIDARFAGQGTFEAPGGEGTIAIRPAGGTVGDVLGPVDVGWYISGGRVNTRAFLPSLRTFAQATIETEAPYRVRGVAAVNALDVRPFAAAYGAVPDGVSGTFDLSAAFEGALSEPASQQAFLNLQRVELTAGALPVTLSRPARITVRRDDFSVDDLALTLGQSTLTVAGRFHDVVDRPLAASYTGQLTDLTTLARAFGVAPEVAATGALTATWESRGGLDRATSNITLSDASVTLPGYPGVQALNARATFDGQELRLDSLSGDWQGGLIAGSARLPRAVLEGTTVPAPAAGRIDVTVKGLTQKALAPWLPPESLAQLDARVSATLGLDVTALALGGLRGALVLDEAAVTAAGVPISQARPAHLSIAGGTVSFDDVAFSAGTPVVIGGTVSVGETTALDLTITGTPGLRPFSVLSPSMAMDGAAEVKLRITGTATAPRLDGRVDLDDAEIVMRDPRVIASDITGPVLFEGDRVTLGNVRGFLNGGDFDASGSARVFGVDVPTGEFTLQARGVAVEYPRNVDSEIDALLSFLPGSAPVLRGDVRVRRGAYRATISVPALVAFNATRTTPVQQPGYFDRLRLDLTVSTDEDIIIDNNYGRFEAGANVRLQGTGTRPALTGRAELREGGEVFLLGGLYRLNESTISFSNPSTIEPEMNISMVTRQNGGEQTLTLSGTLERLETNVVSSDPNADTSVAALLLGGGSTLSGDRAIQLLSGELLGVTGRALGLDSLRLERGFTVDDIRQDPALLAEIDQDPATRLTLSKQLSADVEVVLSQGIGQGKLAGYVTWRPLRGVELRGTSLDNTDRLLSVRHDISFGGTAAVAPTRRTLAPVATVSFDGAPAADESALRGLLRLSPGDPFDFIRWRDDVERLRAWYHRRGYLEARVRASRADADAGRVSLTYTIETGPPTELVFEGMAAPASLRNRLETIWSDAVFDRFLLEEIQSHVRFELLQQHVFDAFVEAAVESTTPTKRIRVTVRDGRRATRREVVYDGVTVFTSAQLDREVEAWGQHDWGWLYPPSIANVVLQRYDAAGYRAAVVTADETIAIVDGVARLTVSVTEGARTVVTSATLADPSVPLAGAVGPMVAALAGKPFRYGDVDDAVRRVDQRYRDAGYNNVRVTPLVTAPLDGTAATVVVEIDPGREQRLAEVVVTGASRTRPGAVVNALRLHPGDPVNLGEWAQGRKRVYDTNVFRQVDVRPEPLPGSNADGTESVRARVVVTEWPTWRLRYGLQLDDTSESAQGDDTAAGRRRDLGVVANLQNRNLFGRAWTFGIFGRGARRLQSGNAYLSFPTLFGRAVQTNVFGSALRADIFPDDDGNPLIRQTKRSVSLEQRIRRGRSMQIVYGYRVTRDIQDGIAGDDDFFYLPLLTGRFTGSAFFDRRDDPFNAARGWFGAVSTERVSEFESGSDSIKVLGTYYRYQPLGPVVLASAVRIGGSFLDPLTSIDPFYIGGADTVRGYQESRIGPRNLSGTATGGNAQLILNQEVRAPIYRFVRGVAFVDAGNVFSSNADISLARLEVGYGVGLRLHTPFSVFRIDLGLPASAIPVATADGVRMRRTPRWYFGLGQIF